MSQISDLILKQVTSSASKVDIPSDIKNKVLGGLSDSILGSLTQTAAKAGGVDQIKALLTGKTAAESSPVTKLATSMFSSNVLGKLGLEKKLSSSLTGLVPVVMTKLPNILKDQDGDGDVDLNDIIITLTGGSGKKGGSLLGAATGILGSFLKK